MNLTVNHERYPVSHCGSLALVVGNHDCRDALRALNAANQLRQLFAQIGIEAGKGLVEQQQSRPNNQCSSQRNPLLLTT